MGDVTTKHLAVRSDLVQVLAGSPDRMARKIDPAHLPAMLCQRDQVGPGSTPQVECATGRVRSQESQQFRRGDTGIPGWFPEVGD